MTFLDQMKKELLENHNVSITENNAVGFATTGTKLLDVNFKMSSYRNLSDNEIVQDFEMAFYENKLMAMKFLFFARDVREGLGERRFFRVVTKWMSQEKREYIRPLLSLFSEFGRWDDLVILANTFLADDIYKIISTQLKKDIDNMNKGENVSLLAKWMPSINTSSLETRKLAKDVIKKLGLTESEYRKTLSALRKHIDVLEVKMSARKWDAIDYSRVPSRANLLYTGAFLRNDEERRRAFLDSVERGEMKINADVLFPHDILHKYSNLSGKQQDLELLWKNLPRQEDLGKTIVVADGSYSMTSRIDGTNISALTVANALAIYFAEQLKGEFKNKYITFSNSPKLVNLGDDTTLNEKIRIALRHSEVQNTNIEKVFKLILSTAIRGQMLQNHLPETILILSDMEFDDATSGDRSKSLFKNIEDKFAEAGFKIPKLVFWNILSRTNTIPLIENDLGVTLVSGFSPNTMKMVMNEHLDPAAALFEVLNSERYKIIEDKYNEIMSR